MSAPSPAPPRASPASLFADRLDETVRRFVPLGREAREFLVCVYLDPEWRFLGMRHVASIARDTATLSFRDVVADALAFEAAAVALAHNHPSGDPTPSAADHAATRRLALVLEAVGVRLIEHVVVARAGTTSFRADGLL